MNEELQKQIAAILKQALDAAQHGGQWMAGQIPDVLHQLLMWTIVEGAIAVALFAFVAPLSVLWMTKWANQECEYGMWSGSKVAAAAIGGFISCISAVFALGAGLDAVKALVAPKLFLLEYAAHLVK